MRFTSVFGVVTLTLAGCAGVLGLDGFHDPPTATLDDGGGEGGSVGEGGGADPEAGGDGGTIIDGSGVRSDATADPVIPCVDRTCSLAQTQVCCVVPTEMPPPPFGFMCAAPGGCPTTGNGSVALACASGANCGGSTPLCCLTKSGNRGNSTCEAACGPADAMLCNPAGGVDCPSTCSTNNIAGWNLPSDYATCGGVIAP